MNQILALPSAILGIIVYTMMGLVGTIFPFGVFGLILLLSAGVIMKLMKVDDYSRKIWRIAGAILAGWVGYIWIFTYRRSAM